MSDNATAGRLRIVVVIGSTRVGRAGDRIAKWFVGQAQPRSDLAIDIMDLADTTLPVILSTSAGLSDGVAKLGERLGAADGFVIVTPEYNHGYPASLKNAIDWYFSEWAAKPVAFVSYGGRAQGIRAVEQLRQVFAELHATTLRDGVSLALETDVDSNGWPRPSAGLEGAAELMIDRLVWWASALRNGRRAQPYEAG